MIRSSRLLLFFRGRTENVQCIKKHVLKVFFASRPSVFRQADARVCGARGAGTTREEKRVYLCWTQKLKTNNFLPSGCSFNDK